VSTAGRGPPTGPGGLPEFIGINWRTNLFSRDFLSNFLEKRRALYAKIHKSAGKNPRGPWKVSTAEEHPPEQLQGVIEASAPKPKAIAHKLRKSSFSRKVNVNCDAKVSRWIRIVTKLPSIVTRSARKLIQIKLEFIGNF